ncbi:MAG: SURF1 family protein [Colwelliaceae bacterium]|nr:SURF1 family protein [Colwelliaceae bacterium]
MKLANFREYISQLNWLIVVFTLLVFSGLIKLGLWQTARALEKEQRIARINQYQSQNALSLPEIISLQKSNENINDLPVMLAGSFDNEKLFLIDNQTHKGRLGYRVLQIFQINEIAVLINLGWVEGFIDRSKLPEIIAITGQHEIKGNIRIVEKGIVLNEEEFVNPQWPLRVQTIEIDKFSALIEQKLLPFVVYLDTKESLGFEKNWRPIVMPPEKHRAYAFQWFSLATAWLVLMISASVWFVRNKPEEE